MAFQMSSLLIHSEHVPERAKDALKAAHDAAPEHRQEMLESAARILYSDTSLTCTDVRELVDLPDGPCV